MRVPRLRPLRAGSESYFLLLFCCRIVQHPPLFSIAARQLLSTKRQDATLNGRLTYNLNSAGVRTRLVHLLTNLPTNGSI